MRRRKKQEYNPKVNNQNPVFCVGLLFPTCETLKGAIKEYAIKYHIDVKLVKNDKEKIRAWCQGDCSWQLYSAVEDDRKAYKIKTYNDGHTCGLNYKSKYVTAKWLAKRFLGQFRANPSWNDAGFQTSHG